MENHEQHEAQQHGAAHPSPAKYIQIAVWLTLITLFEVLIYYVEAVADYFVAIFLILSALKFLLVAMFYMHLKFDDRLFSGLFIFGLVLATGILLALMALFAVLL